MRLIPDEPGFYGAPPEAPDEFIAQWPSAFESAQLMDGISWKDLAAAITGAESVDDAIGNLNTIHIAIREWEKQLDLLS